MMRGEFENGEMFDDSKALAGVHTIIVQFENGNKT